uniref:Uncharacterized protein n=1 Tax=Meloidogyne floridensis TaxID=298350 RepID=A0A915NJ07_9BILA
MEPKNTLQLLKKSTFPIKCCICGYIASGFIYYNVKCCD